MERYMKNASFSCGFVFVAIGLVWALSLDTKVIGIVWLIIGACMLARGKKEVDKNDRQ